MSNLKENIESIKSLQQQIKDKYNTIIAEVGPIYEKCGKLLADRLISEVKNKLQNYIDNGITYEKNVKGHSWTCVRINFTEYPEFKNFNKLVDGPYHNDNLENAVKNVLNRYGFREFPYFIEHETSCYSNDYILRFDLINFEYPDYPGTPGFFEEQYKKLIKKAQ